MTPVPVIGEPGISVPDPTAETVRTLPLIAPVTDADSAAMEPVTLAPVGRLAFSAVWIVAAAAEKLLSLDRFREPLVYV